jgi:hypothetical protein
MAKTKNTRKMLWSSIVFALYFLATVHSAIVWNILVGPFQEHGASPDLIIALTHPPLPLKILGLLVSAVSFILADTIMVSPGIIRSFEFNFES